MLERFHKEPRAATATRTDCGSCERLFEIGWRRTGFGATDDELQFRDRAREALRIYWDRSEAIGGRTGLARAQVRLQGSATHHVRGRVDRVDRLPDGDYELIDYKTGERRTEAELENDLQLALYRLAAREAWDVEASTGSYYYVLDADKVPAPTRPTTPSGSSARCCRSARASSARTSSRARRRRSAPGATTG